MRVLTFFILLGCIIGNTYEAYASLTGINDVFQDEDSHVFKRTYKPGTPFSLEHRYAIKRSSDHNRAVGVVITYENLLDHLALNKVRQYVEAEASSSHPLTMDVGGIDLNGDTPQTWIMPDLSSFATNAQMIDHVDWSATGLEVGYPEQTHAFYIPTVDTYEFYELTQDDLFLYGMGNVDEDEVYFEDWYLTMAPLPLEWGLDYEGTVVFIYEEDPDYDSTIFIQHYEVVAHGTLETYDEGSVNAVKLHFTEEIKDYKDGEVIENDINHEVVWYSEEGHYLRGLLEEGGSFTDETSFDILRYQKISQSVSTEQLHGADMTLDLFPNPVSAGDVLTISIKQELHLGLIQLYDMQGRLVQQMDVSGLGAVRNFRVQLPSDLMSGMYTYQVQSPKGESLAQGKLNIR
jgi:hypothetical protein